MSDKEKSNPIDNGKLTSPNKSNMGNSKLENLDIENPSGNGVLSVGDIRNLIEEDANSYLKGVRNTDVDWFLRDSGISTSTPPSTEIGNVQNSGPGDRSKDGNSPISQVSSHLNTDISNTNDFNSTKTKASIAPIQEENVASSPPLAPHQPTDSYISPLARRRRASSVSSMGSAGSSASVGSSGGFLSKLKGKIHKIAEPVVPVSPSSPTVKPVATPSSPEPIFKANYDLKSSQRASSKSVSNLSSSPQDFQTRISRSMSTPNANESLDPRLDEYIKFYQQKNARRGSQSLSRSSSTDRKNSIPSHPAVSPLPSALVNGFENVTYKKPAQPKPAPPPEVQSTTGKLSSFLRRRSISSAPVPVPTSEKNRYSSESTLSLASSPTLVPLPISHCDIHPSFKELKPLRQVAFHLSTFLIDPPQQIPSRTPRKGNVEVLPNGVVRINPLTEEDKLAIEKSQMGQGGGIVVGGTGALGLIPKSEQESDEIVTEPSEHLSDKDGEEDTAVDKHAKLLAIDKPMFVHKPVVSSPAPIKKMALDLMYTRCCHLREILPIPAILKQIPKGSMAPLPMLQLRNPTPTLVEIQTFADFVRISPVICVSLDGVSLSLEQFKILLSAMSAKKQLEKFSLRNTPIDHDGWSLLCWFLSRNTVLNRLDITQCPSLSVNVLKKKKKKSSDSKKDETEIQRMTCNRENRSDMDWSLFVATLVARGGIEDLILTGCCIMDLDIFEKLIILAVLKKTFRLGLAYNQLTPKHFKILVDNWMFQDFARGLDLGYNDFLSVKMINVLLEEKKKPNFNKTLSKCMLTFLSLNSTNILFTEAFKDTFENILMKLPNLKYLDFSNNPRLFGTNIKSPPPVLQPSAELSDSSKDSTSSSTTLEHSDSTSELRLDEATICAYFTSKLPLFPKLVRLHLENINFSQESLISIAKVLPFCKYLGYFSLLGNKMELNAGSAMIQGLKNSKSLITLDCDYDDFPDFFKEQIGLYTMRNMERLLNDSKKNNTAYANSQKEKPAEVEEESSESLTEQLCNILELKSKQVLDMNSSIVTKFIDKARKIRLELKETIDELLKLQLKNELNLDGKETLIRFLFIDSSVEKGLLLIDNSIVDKGSHHPSMLLQGAEDEKNKYSIYKSDSHLSDDGKLQTPRQHNIPPNASPLAISRSTSRTNLNSLDRQEGSVLKLLKLHDFDIDNSDLTDGFLNKWGGMSGDDIRKRLMGVDFSDLDKIIDYLGKLKDRGISLEKVFNSSTNESQENKLMKQSDALRIIEIKNQLRKLADKQSDDTKEEDPSTDETKGVSDGDMAKEVSNGEIREAYDKVLRSMTLQE